MQFPQYSSKVTYSVASIVVIVVTVIIDVLFLDKDTVEFEKTPKVEVRAEPPKTTIESAFQIRLSDTPVPEPFASNKSASTAQPKAQAPNEIETTPIKHTKVVAKNNYLAEARTALSTLSEHEMIYEQSYQQMVALNDQNRTLYFIATNENELTKTIDYMHQCVGISLASYDGNQLTKLNSPNRFSQSEYSKMLRMVSGFKSNFEQALIDTYAPGQSLIRLYPKWFDLTLAQHISNHIKQQALTQFSGAYLLTNKRLQLTNISINNIPVKENWTIQNGC